MGVKRAFLLWVFIIFLIFVFFGCVPKEVGVKKAEVRQAGVKKKLVKLVNKEALRLPEIMTWAGIQGFKRLKGALSVTFSPNGRLLALGSGIWER
jgi:hypothetical protein